MARQVLTTVGWSRAQIDGAGVRGYYVGVYCPVCSLQNRYYLSLRNDPYVKGPSTCDCDPGSADHLYAFTFDERVAIKTDISEAPA
jgi:hypothetical protein